MGNEDDLGAEDSNGSMNLSEQKNRGDESDPETVRDRNLLISEVEEDTFAN